MLNKKTTLTNSKTCHDDMFKENFETFFNAIRDFLFVLDHQGTIIHVNTTVFERLGYTKEELIGQSVLMIHPEDQRELAAKIVSDIILKKEEYCPVPLMTKNGKLIPVETRISKGQWNGSFAFFGVSKDITALKLSEEKFSRAFDNSAALMAISTVDEGHFIEVNSSFTEVTGYSKKEAIGKTSSSLNLFVVPEQRNKIKSVFERHGSVRDISVDIRAKNGNIIKGLFSIDQINMGEGKCWLTVMTDITDLKRAEESLRKLNNIQHHLIGMAKNFLNVPTDKQNEAIDKALSTIANLIMVDRAYLFSYDFNSMTMSNTNEWCAEGISPEIENLQQLPLSLFPEWVDHHKRGELVHIPSVEALPQGNLKKILNAQDIKSVVSLPLMQGKKCTGFVGFDAVRKTRSFIQEEIDLLWVLSELFSNFELRHKTDQKLAQLYAEQKELVRKANQSSLSKGMFVANMSHEIRTPLNAILGYAQIMDRECGNCPHKQKGLNAIAKSGEHLLELINDILETVKTDVQEVKLSPVTFDIINMILELKSMFAHRPDARNIFISAQFTSHFPRFIHSDKGKIRQVLLNLIGNAVKFTEKGTISILADSYETKTNQTNSNGQITLCLSIEDTGYGIAKNHQELIFDAFEQSESGHRAAKGTGLGLPLSRRYARALGGDICVDSQLNMGSIFTFTFKASAVLRYKTRKKECAVIKVINSFPRILIVDDDLFNREMLNVMLSGVGFDIVEANSGMDALEKLKTNSFDAILLDHCMPDIDGIETLHRIRNLPGGQHLPVIIITASGELTAEIVKKEGANAFISKPLSRSDLLEKIQELIGVVYEYHTNQKTHDEKKGYLSKSVNALTSKEKNNILSGIQNGDIQLLRQTMDVIEKKDHDLSIILRGYVNSYDYEGLSRLIH